MKRYLALLGFVVAMHVRAIAMSSTDYESMYNIAEAKELERQEAEQRREEETIARAGRAGEYERAYWESQPDYSGHRARRMADEDRAAREERVSAYGRPWQREYAARGERAIERAEGRAEREQEYMKAYQAGQLRESPVEQAITVVESVQATADVQSARERLRAGLDYVSDAYNSLKDRISPKAAAALQDAKKWFKEAWEETDKRTAGARAKMNEYVNRGLESLREARAQMPQMPSLPRGEAAWMSAPGYVPARMQGPSYKLEQPYAPAVRTSASAWAKDYRTAVKGFDTRKKLKDMPGYAAILQQLIAKFNAIKTAIQANPELKRAVTTSVVPLLVRVWKSEDVLIGYIDEYLKKLENEFASFQLRKQFGSQLTDVD